MGSLMLVWFEGDVEKAFGDLATDDSEYMMWFRARVLDVTGVDLGAPSDDPPPAILIDYQPTSPAPHAIVPYSAAATGDSPGDTTWATTGDSHVSS